MSNAPQGWQTPKTNWASADVPAPADFNRMEGNANAIETGSRTLDPAQSPSGNAGTLRQILSWLANRIKAIMGTTNWYDTPPTTLQAAKQHIDNTSNPHNVTALQVGAIPTSDKGSAGGTEPSKVAVTDGSGRVGHALRWGDSARRLFVQSTTPTATAAGDQWYDTTSNRWKYWNGREWVDPLKLV